MEVECPDPCARCLSNTKLVSASSMKTATCILTETIFSGPNTANVAVLFESAGVVFVIVQISGSVFIFGSDSNTLQIPRMIVGSLRVSSH